MLDLEPQANLYKIVVIDAPNEISKIISRTNQRIERFQLSPIQLILITLFMVFVSGFILRALSFILWFLKDPRKNFVVGIFRFIVKLPCGRKYLEKEQANLRKDFESRVRSKRKTIVKSLPDKPWDENDILKRIK